MSDNAALYAEGPPPSESYLSEQAGVGIVAMISDADGCPTKYQLRINGVDVVLNVMPANRLAAHLGGFAGWVQATHEQIASAHTSAVIDKLRRIRTVLGCVITPAVDAQGKVAEFLFTLNHDQDGLMFAGDTVYGADGEALAGAELAEDD